MYYEMIIMTLVVVVFLMTVINFYSIFMMYQNVTYICRRVVRAIEVEGAYSSDITDLFDTLKVELDVPDAEITISNVTYFDHSARTIQLRETFTITVSYTFQMEILNPMFTPPVTVPIPLTAKLTGMSEVYHKIY